MTERLAQDWPGVAIAKRDGKHLDAVLLIIVVLMLMPLSVFPKSVGARELPVASRSITGDTSDEGVAGEELIPDTISFNFHVRPILSENCFYCHGPDANKRYADLRLDTLEGGLNAIEPGDAESSELIQRIYDEADAEYQMPPPDSGRKLTQRQKDILKKWIEQGARYETHWAFTPPVKPDIPGVKDKEWARNPIDRFVLAELERRQIEPSPRANPTTLIRRMHADLVGIPPTTEQVDTFLDEYSEDADAAVDRLADQLLASPHYGEQMSLPWLDAARYSDSNGFQEDGDRSQWPWRDWVIAAMNNDMPFDQFTIEQLAGDLLPNPSRQQLVATAFNRHHMLNGEGGALAEEQRNNYVFDRVDTTATTWLGMTMACAQCHDHKYDPITQKDYYKFFAFFNNVDESGRVDLRINRIKISKPYLELANEQQRAARKKLSKKIHEQRKKLAAGAAEIDADVRKWEEAYQAGGLSRDIPRNIFKVLDKKPAERSQGDFKRIRDYYLDNAATGKWKQAQNKLREFEREERNLRSQIATVMIMRERKKPRDTHILDRGNYEAKKEMVASGIPDFLSAELNSDTPMSRLDLANWLVSAANPLTSRVQVNRYWQLFFGTGLVKTAEDFGVQGELPSHPELLDWLAVDFRENGWQVKRIHRMIVTSETYLQSSKFRPDLIEIDPENRLLARGSRFRMHAMAIRDHALQVSGLLSTQVGGKPVYPPQPEGLWKEFSLERFSYKPSVGDARHRRSLYTFWRRTVPPPNMFDASNRQTCTVKLSRTNTPLHALTLLNDATYVEAACALAHTALSDHETDGENYDAAALLDYVFRRCMGRDPNSSNRKTLQLAWEESLSHFNSHPSDAHQYIDFGTNDKVTSSDSEAAKLAALACVVQIVMNTDEFITRE